MNVICLQDEAFYALIENVLQRINENKSKKEDRWISGEEAMQKLRIKSKTTLQKFRDEGRIRFTQFDRKHILYDSESIEEYLENHARNTF